MLKHAHTIHVHTYTHTIHVHTYTHQFRAQTVERLSAAAAAAAGEVMELESYAQSASPWVAAVAVALNAVWVRLKCLQCIGMT